MPSTSDVLDQALSLVNKRLGELDEERKRLERAFVELGGASAKRGPGRPRKASASAAAAPSKRRRKGGTRADQTVELVEKKPGISASEIAKALKIKPNYLYRVLGELEKEKRVKKDGRAYFPV